MYLDTRDIMITPGILTWGDWEPETTKTLERVLRPGMQWADVGANIGYFTIIGHKMVRDGGRTFAFEANPETYSLLVDNIKLNWFWSGVEAEQKAVFSKTGDVTFSAPEKFNVNAAVREFADDELTSTQDVLRRITVPACSLDDYFGDRNLDFIKIDIEGAESYALSGARRLLSRNPGIMLVIEWSPGQMIACGTSPVETLEEIHSQGFSCWLAEGDRRRVSLENLMSIQDTTMVMLTRDSNFAW
ncbi:FkbM family methyltransferase [Inquilinus limosus]|uniref:FkbM family methyltransferase n=1 Tax=Inquilinus limosus TaxID=171674 RepID=UPI0009DCCCB2|nr:FkbM family methyltransferase [Inquilinus limosus]